MDLEILEQLALLDDRRPALAQLLPGSEDHDYYRCLAAQHAGALADADAILAAWPERHGSTERYARSRARQLLYRLAADPASTADEVRDMFGVQHWHEAEVDATAPMRATRLAPGAFDGRKLLQQAYDYDTNLSQVTDEGLYELIDRPLDATRRRVLLSRIGHTPQPEVVALVADDLAAQGGNFGTLAIHAQLTLAQLQALAERRPELRTHDRWIGAVVQRMRPSAEVDLELDRDARAAHLATLWQFVGTLPAARSLKAHVLWHILDTARARDVAQDEALVEAYLQLPRAASYVSRTWLERIARNDLAQLGGDFREQTGLPPAGDDEGLVRELIHRNRALAERCARWLDREWLDRELATATLLYGATSDADRATLTLGPAHAAALRERVDLVLCPHNASRFASGERIALAVDVKHVAELVVNVFRIDPLAYFQHHHREVSTDLDLDGLAASHELVVTFAHAPIARHREVIELPMCTRPGTYVIDLIGNGISSRAVVHKGRLRHVARVGAAGHVVTIVDEVGRSQPEARAWLGDREYRPDDSGAFVVPFSTAPNRTPMLLFHDDIATVQSLELQRESYALAMGLALDRESLVAGATVRALARVELFAAGRPASLALLKRTTWEVTLTDRQGIATTKSQPLELSEDRTAVLTWPMGEDTSRVTLAVRGVVEVISEQREQELSDVRTFEVASMNAGAAIEALYLARTAAGWVLSALGKTGEPRAQRPVTVNLVHRWARTILAVELATDARGRIELGELPGIATISATLGTTQSWTLDDAAVPVVRIAAAGRDLVIPLPASRGAADMIARASLVELRGNLAMKHPAMQLEPLAGGIAIHGLPAGEYHLRGPGVMALITVASPGHELGGSVIAGGDVLEAPRSPAVIAALEVGETIRISIRGATADTRVHVIATRFVPALVEPLRLRPARNPARRADRARGAQYVSGRELGDEYRYILDRRGAKRYPSLQLERPGLLLNPWSRRATSTDIAVPKAGHAYGAPAAPPQQAAPAGGPMGGAAAAYDDAYLSYDFLAAPAIVLADLLLDDDDVVHLERAALGDATSIAVILDDPAWPSVRHAALAEQPLAPRDLRLLLALDPARHATQQKAIAPLRAGERLEIRDLATAQVHLLDSVARAHAYLLALREDATLREFAFVARWHELPDAERRELYLKYACHELHLFLYFKDRPYFDATIRPYLAHKRVKTFVDHWLLDADLAGYLEPGELARLNAVELALLAHRLPGDDALPRLLADAVAVVPPDPQTDTRLIDALLGASALDAPDDLRELAAAATVVAQEEARGGMFGIGGQHAAPAARPMKAKKTAKAEAEGGDDYQDMAKDRAMRMRAEPMFRAADRTQEWAEHNWWHQTPNSAALIAANRLWRDLAAHRGGGFLSPWLGLATGSFAEAMCALAVTELPFVAAAHAMVPAGPHLAITAAGNALAGSSQLVDGELASAGPPLVVGQNYVRADDRHDYIDGEQVDKYIDNPFAAGVVYSCLVVLANPTSSRQRISALVQIPRGSIAVAGGRPTRTIDVILPPYGTHGHEYSFYVPFAGACSHFPVHVSAGAKIVAAAPSHALTVVTGDAAPDPRSWAYLSQHAQVGELVEYLATANLAAIDLPRCAWRLRDRAAYDAILGALERRRAFDHVLWGYALAHRDRPRLRVFIRQLDAVLSATGPVLEPFARDAEQLGVYEHLEYAPLTNARAHRLGAKLRILNDGLAAQYARFLDLVAHRSRPTAEDLLAAAAYLMTQDRVDPALAVLTRVPRDAVADRMQHDYLAAYAACLRGEVAHARELATRWRELPMTRWQRRFAALEAMLDEHAGAAPTIVDPRNREQQQAELAARQPAFELQLDRDGITVRSQHVAALELRFFEMDVELLFSRQPFVQSDVSRFSFIEPGHREQLADLAPESRVAWPAQLRGRNVVVEAVGAGLRKAKVHYANDLAINVAHQYGQVRVQRASDLGALPASYVKVYARKHGGEVAFYKDGYSDLRGWFDYASLSTNELDNVERFAILVSADRAGAAILEANPPGR